MSIFIDDVSEPGSWERAIRHGGLDCREHGAGDRETQVAGSETKAGAVHADHMIQNGARHHVR